MLTVAGMNTLVRGWNGGVRARENVFLTAPPEMPGRLTS